MTTLPPPTQAVTDSSGHITQPWYQYFSGTADDASASATTAASALSSARSKGFFHVDLNSTGQTVAEASTGQALLFNHEVYDTDSWYDSTLGTYTPLEAGYYQFHLTVYTTRDRDGESIDPFIMRNSSPKFFGTYLTGQTTLSVSAGSVSGMLSLNGTTDIVTFGVYSPSTFVRGDPNLTYAYGYKIGST